MNLDLLKALCEAHGAPGREDAPRSIIEAELRMLGVKARQDALGNLIAVDAAGGGSGPCLLLDAHMDEVALMVAHIHPGGAVGFAPLGGWDARNLPAQEVTIRTSRGPVRGVIGSKPPHISGVEERNKAWAIDALWIDLGTLSEDETRGLGVQPGDPVILDGPFARLESGVIRAKALDDRAGCFVVIETLRALRGQALPFRVSASFSVMEEVGTRGIKAVMGSLDCEVALHLEATVAADVPGVPAMQCPSVFGGGPVITVADNGIIVAERMISHLEETAFEHDIPCQRKRPIYGGTNAGAAHLTGAGVLCGVISLPCRYIHSPVSLLREDDLRHAINLTTHAVRGAGRLFGQ